MEQPELLATLTAVWALFLLGASAFFSSSETALVSLSPQKAKRLALKNPSLSQDLLGWIGNPHELLTLILIGNTFATVLFAASVSALAIQIFRLYSPSLINWITWILETMAVVIFGDMAPKFFARAQPEKTSMAVLPWLSRIRSFLGPVMKLSAVVTFFLPGFKGARAGGVLTFSMTELRAMLEEGSAAGSVSFEFMGMMQRVLETNDRRADEIMTPIDRVDLIDLDAKKGKDPPTRDFLLDLIIENGHTRTPVRQGGHVTGFIHSDDLLPLLLNDDGRNLQKFVRQAMDVPRRQSVADLLQNFRRSGVYLGFVQDEKERVIGIVTLEDVLEEITGEILDEYDLGGIK